MIATGTAAGLAAAAPIVGAGIDALANVGSGLFNINQARKNRAFQERMYFQQLKDNRENWNLQNAYNHPLAVLNRMREAGLNPLLMYEGGTSLTSSSAAQGASAPSGAMAQADFRTNFTSAMTQAALLQAQIRNINADTEQKEQAAQNTAQQTQNLNLQWQFDKDTFHIRKLMEYGNYDRALSEIRKNDNDVFNTTRLATGTLINLQYINENLVKRYHLDAFVAGQNALGMWENIKLGKQNVAIGWKNAASNWLNALTNARVGNAQAGLLFTQTKQLNKMMPLLIKSQRLTNMGQQVANFRNAIGIYSDAMNMNKTQAETFRLNFENMIMQNTGFGVGNGTFQQILALPIVSFGQMFNKIF